MAGQETVEKRVRTAEAATHWSLIVILQLGSRQLVVNKMAGSRPLKMAERNKKGGPDNEARSAHHGGEKAMFKRVVLRGRIGPN